jgi:hypothetical protein
MPNFLCRKDIYITHPRKFCTYLPPAQASIKLYIFLQQDFESKSLTNNDMDTLISVLCKLFCLKDDSNEQGTGKSQSVFWSENTRIPSCSDSEAPWGSVRSSTYDGASSSNWRRNRSHHSPSVSSDLRPKLGSFHGAGGTQSSYHGSVSGSHLSGSGRSHRTGSHHLSASGLPALGSMSSIRQRHRKYPHICEVANYF